MNRQTIAIGGGLLAVIVVAIGILIYLQRDQSGATAPPVGGPGRAEEARGIIADIEARRAGTGVRSEPDLIERPTSDDVQAAEPAAPERPPTVTGAGADTELDAAFERAEALQAAGKLDDAQVLYFFGARQGHARSAFAYAELNDPNHHSPETSLLPEPDAFQAFRWYSVALDGGLAAAADRLDALHEWALDAAAAGDAEAEQLLLQWE